MPQTSDGIVSPDDTDKYKLVPQLAALAETTQLALNKRANYYTGTTAQRTAFTSAAGEGVAWKDTNGTKSLYVKEGTAWSLVWPVPRYDSGTVDSFLSSSTGWSVAGSGTSWIRRVNNWIVGRVEFNRTGAAISVNARGDITNSIFCTLQTPWRPDSVHPLTAAESGRSWTGHINSAGAMSIAAVGGTENISNGEIFSTRFIYPYRLADM